MKTWTPLLSLALLLAVPAPAQDETAFSLNFGQFGDPGAFRVQFVDDAASIYRVWLLDHSYTAAVGNKEFKEIEDYLTVAYDVELGLPSLVLEQETGRGYQFPKPTGLFPEISRWQRQVFDDGSGVRFTLDGGNGLRLEKVIRHRPGRRELLVEVALIAGDGFANDSGPTQMFCSLTGLMLSKETVKVQSSMFGQLNRAIGQLRTVAGDLAEPMAKGPSEIPGPNWHPLIQAESGNRVEFAGTTSRFFANFVYPLDEASGTALYKVDARTVPYGTPHPAHADGNSDSTQARYHLRLMVPKAGQESRVQFGFYIGPKSNRVFGEVPGHERFAPIMDVDLEPLCCVPVPGVRFLAGVLLSLLGLFESLCGSWGFAIVMLTLVVRGALVPLNFRMQRSMRAYGAKMAVLKPKLDELNKKYAGNKQELQKQMIAFQREHKMFPPLGGCLPMFLTMPVWIGLFTALRVAYDLRHQPFLFVDDLAQPDALFGTGIAFQPVFNILPILMVGLWWWLSASQPLPKDPQQRSMAKMMRIMPLMFGVMLYNYASGLLIYMITSSIFGLVEQRIVRRILGPASAEAGAVYTPPVM